MTHNTSKWGKDKARERYAGGGGVPTPKPDPRKAAKSKGGQLGWKSGGKVK